MIQLFMHITSMNVCNRCYRKVILVTFYYTSDRWLENNTEMLQVFVAIRDNQTFQAGQRLREHIILGKDVVGS
jgi:hypothetical protein